MFVHKSQKPDLFPSIYPTNTQISLETELENKRIQSIQILLNAESWL